jgi:pimeloyl-ACP methyl ester carboxylesterase
MHLTCRGSGDTTVVLVAGFEDGGASWGEITPAVRREARVCGYARYGTGTSDPAPRPQTFATQAQDLHGLLTTAGEPGPYVVLGHSFGGDVAVTFASRFRDEVQGLLLLDASPVGWPEASCAVPADGSGVADSFRQSCTMLSGPRHNAERLDAFPAFAEAGEVGSLRDLPLSVLTRDPIAYPGMAAASQRALVRVWNDGQDHWTSLSTVAELVPVPNSGHYIQLDQPAVVIEHLLALLPGR